ncbi:Hypothetical predicted protein [Paramuricea clavata]|uniref:Uncharacterized protein n=1 Tax=Paramuricea clavata TaxID=317549 RepID=A0A6S7K506_PARCT|nr:Hypothetical predicted protein [Paramuricea clavata]
MAYISNISFVVSDSKVKGVPNMINVDLNSGSRGNFIYPLKHFSDNKNEAIAGLAFIQGNALVPNGYTKIDQDLNKGAGGTYNYLCITKVGGNKMTAIDFLTSGKKRTEKTINGYFRYGADLNTGTREVGNYVYLLYKTDKGKAFD